MIFLVVGVIVTSCLLTGLMRLYALEKKLIDAPNERSSHVIPTPRGGGMSIVLLFLLFVVWGYIQQKIEGATFLAFSGSGLLVAGIGFWDDHGHVSARLRLLIHFIAAGWCAYWLGGIEPCGQLTNPEGLYCLLRGSLVILALVWSLNLFNFMDGIDGLAGCETFFIFGGGAFIYWFTRGTLTFEFLLMVVLSSAALGFLTWNWPPAKIFMGDACSGFLGFMIIMLAFVTEQDDGVNYWSWLILYGVFVVDSAVTLLRRFFRGEKVYKAHRSHVYQILSYRWRSHLKVTLCVSGINFFWLFPLALLSAIYPHLAAPLALLAFLPLVVISVIVGAGRSDT